jgi:hypothetical protein
MQLRRRQLVIVLMLIICIGCYVAEICDTWDSSIQSGTDTEFSIVRLVLSVASVFAFVRIALLVLRRIDRCVDTAADVFLTCHCFNFVLQSSPEVPALAPLRI